MAVLDAQVAAVADEMGERPGMVVHAVVVDAEDAEIFGEVGEAAGAAEEAIGRDGRARGGGHGAGKDDTGEARGQGFVLHTPDSQ